MLKSFTTEGIVLKRNNTGEADRILTIFSKRYGKIIVIAKGIRRSSSRKGGNLELFNQVRIFVAKGRNLDLVTEVETLNSFQNWRKNLRKIAVAYELCELVDKLTVEGVENQEVYDLLVNYLSNLSSISDQRSAVDHFELSLLQALGFWPRGKILGNFNLESYIENLINRRLQAKIFSRKINEEKTFS